MSTSDNIDYISESGCESDGHRLITIFHTSEIEVLEEIDEMDPPLLGDERKWLIVNEMVDHKRHNDLLIEVEYLKNMVVEMHKLMVLQGENVNRLGNNVDKMNESVIFVSKEISSIKGKEFSYIKDYLFPALRLAGTYTPFIMLMSAKTGIASSLLSFLFFRIFS